MSDEDKLFQQNPLLAIWIKMKEMDKKLKNLLDDLDEEDNKVEESGSYE